MPATKTSNNDVAEMAQAIAQQIVERRESGAIELAGLTGSFTLQIKYKDTTYSLVVTIPDTAGGVYVFSLTETDSGGKSYDIATFKYKDTSNWQVAVGLPFPITFGDFTIQTLKLELGEGAVTA